jgi:hypothetical protein
MSHKKFPNHTGGVLRVHHNERWGSVPEALLEDERLALDSRAVASWLAVKPSGWKISVGVLQRRLGTLVRDTDGEESVYRDLSKGRWQRIARELELTGYLTRQITNGDSGQWTWNIVFNPRPPSEGFPRAVFSSDGVAGDGAASAGEPSHKGIPRKKSNTKRTTTTPTGQKRGTVDEPIRTRLVNVVVDKYAEQYQDVLLALLSRGGLADDEAQQIADELAGLLEAAAAGRHDPIRDVRGWITFMIEQHRKGDFLPVFGRLVATKRRPPEAAKISGEERADKRFVSACIEEMRNSLRYAGAPKEKT